MPGRRRRLLPILSMGATLLCLPAAAGVAILGGRVSDHTADHDARAAAVVAARSHIEDILSYDYRTVADDIAKAKSEATGVFAREYAESAAELAAQAKQNRVIVQASAASPAVVTATADQVVVLVFVDQVSVKQLRGQRSPETRIDQSRVRITMTRVGARWLVSQLAAL